MGSPLSQFCPTFSHIPLVLRASSDRSCTTQSRYQCIASILLPTIQDVLICETGECGLRSPFEASFGFGRGCRRLGPLYRPQRPRGRLGLMVLQTLRVGGFQWPYIATFHSSRHAGQPASPLGLARGLRCRQHACALPTSHSRITIMCSLLWCHVCLPCTCSRPWMPRMPSGQQAVSRPPPRLVW